MANFQDGFLDDIDIAQALFGDEETVYRKASGKIEHRRKSNGLWSPRSNTRVSAVITIDRANPWSFWDRTPVLWLNPWASNPLDKQFYEHRMEIRETDASNGAQTKTDGKDFAGILGLDKDLWESVFQH